MHSTDTTWGDNVQWSITVPAVATEERFTGWRWWVHNIVAHPLLVLWPRVGEWLHDRTVPDPGEPLDAPPLATFN